MNENDKWHKVSLWIASNSLEPEQITSKLGLTPSFLGRMGEPYGRKPPAPGIALRDTNLWILSSDADDHVSFEDQMPPLLELLESRIGEFKDIASTMGTEVDLFLGFSSDGGQGGACLPLNLL